MDRRYLELALVEAEQAFAEGTYPIGAVLVGPDGELICVGRNRVHSEGDCTAHAEIDAIRNAGAKLQDSAYKYRCTLYSTVEPCPMCSGAIVLADIGRVVWVLSDDYLGAFRRYQDDPYFGPRFRKVGVTVAPYPELAERQRNLMKSWDASRGYETNL